MPLNQGFDNVRRYLDQAAQSRTFGGDTYLILRADGEAARIRFLGEIPLVGMFHRLQIKTQSGKTRPGDPIPCTEDETCEICANVQEGSQERARFLTWFHVFIYYQDHTRQNAMKGGKPWEQVSVGGRVCYRESVGAPRLLLAGSKLANKITTFYERLGTVTDRDYDIVRSGEGLDTEYELIASTPDPMRKDIISVAETLTPLEDIAYGRNEEGEPAKSANESRPSGGATTRGQAGAPADEGLVDLESPAEAAADTDIAW